MTDFAAFIRGINVGGNRIVRMSDLAQIFTLMGLRDVRTYIQSGNVVFRSARKDSEALAGAIAVQMYEALGCQVAVMLRTGTELRQIVAADPFGALREGGDAKIYVTFLSGTLTVPPQCPLMSPGNDVKILHATNRELFSLSLPAANGRFGFPNAFIEKQFRMEATTRNWNTVCRMAEM